MNNTSQKPLDSYTEFYIDDDNRQSYTEYVTEHITDITDPNYGNIYVNPIEAPTLSLEGQSNLNTWQLDLSKFPPQAVVKVRYKVSGKGYAPRLRFISKNQLAFELVDISWVFRTLYAR